jgi:glycosyltransferase involved in cell wall biosynthesis
MKEASKIKFKDFLPENFLRLASGGKRFEGQFKDNKESPLVSIVTVVLNGEKYLRDTIESVLNQDFQNIEYIIIDGGSIDQTHKIIKEYEEKIDIWYSEPDEGIADAFNKGLCLCRGDLIGIINSDDWLEQEAITNLVKNYRYREDEWYCGKLKFWRDGKIYCTVQSCPEKLVQFNSIPHQTIFTTRNFHENYGIYDQNYKFAMDYDLFLKAYLMGSKPKNLPITFSNMRYGGVSSIQTLKVAKEFYSIKNKYLGKKIAHKLFFLETHLKYFCGKILRYFKLNWILKCLKKIFYFFRGMRHVEYK